MIDTRSQQVSQSSSIVDRHSRKTAFLLDRLFDQSVGIQNGRNREVVYVPGIEVQISNRVELVADALRNALGQLKGRDIGKVIINCLRVSPGRIKSSERCAAFVRFEHFIQLLEGHSHSSLSCLLL